MARKEVLVIRLNETEREALDRLARVEKLPTSTYVRRRLLMEVDQRGLWPVRREEVEREAA